MDEADGTVTVQVSPGTGYLVGASSSAQVVVQDNDDAPSGIALAASPATVSESDGATTVTVTASPTGGTLFGLAQTVRVSVSGSGDQNAVGFSAVADFDVSIPAGAASGADTFTLTPTDNTVDNADETITIKGAASPSGTPVAPATLALEDDDEATVVRPPAPTNFTAVAGDGELALSWSGAAGATSYELRYRGDGDAAPSPWPWSSLGDVTTHTLQNLTNGKAYLLFLRGRNGAGAGRTARTRGTPAAPVAVPVITISAVSDTVSEGASAAFTLTAKPAPATSLTVSLSSSGGDGFLKDPPPSSVTVGAGASEVTVRLPTVDDAVDEPDGAVTVQVSAGVGYSVGTSSSARVVVKDNDPVKRPRAPANFTAVAGAGELALSWSRAAGATSYELRYRGDGDAKPSPWPWSRLGDVTTHTLQNLTNGKRYVVFLRGRNGAGAGRTARVRGTPVAPAAPIITIAAVADTVTEGAAVAFKLTASPAPAAPVTVSLSSSGGAGFLTGLPPSSATLEAGASEAAIRLPTEDDRVDDPDGAVTMQVAAGDGYTVAGDGLARVVVRDDDDPPTGISLTVSPTEILESDGATTVSVTASPTGGTFFGIEQTVRVSVTGSGDSDAVDFAAVSGLTVTIPAGASSGVSTFTLTPEDDEADEVDELVTLKGKASPSGSPVAQTTLTLTDDDIPVISISAGGSVTEGAAASYAVVALPAPVRSLTVNLLLSGTLHFLSGGAPQGEVVVPAGEISAVLTIATDDDLVDEPDGALKVQVTPGDGYSVGAASSAQVVVKDDDAPPTGIALSALPATVLESEDATTVTVKASPTGGTLFGSAQTVRVSAAGSGVSDVVGFGAVSDFEVLIPAGKESGENTFTLTPVKNEVNNADETVTLTGTASPSDSPVSPATVTLIDDDTPVITISGGGAVTEGSPAVFTVSASLAPARTLTVNLLLSGALHFLDGDDGSPGSSVSGSMAILAGETSTTQDLATEDDAVDEPDGVLTVRVVPGDGYTAGAADSAQVTIRDNDDPSPVPPPAPSDFTASPGKRRLVLSWSPTAGAVSYEIRHRLKNRPKPDPWPWTNVGATTTHTITKLQNKKAYLVQLRAVNAAGAGPGVEVTAKPGNPLSTRITAGDAASTPPVAVRILDDVALEAGASVTLDVTGAFAGEALTYSVSSMDEGVAGATAADGVAKVTGVRAGRTTLAVVARNTAGAASLVMNVTVTVPARDQVAFKRVLAAMGRGVMAGARSTLLARLDDTSASARVALAGRPVRDLTSGLTALLGVSGYEIPSRWDDPVRRRTVEKADVLRNSAFAYTLRHREEAADGRRVALWGTGSAQAFRGGSSADRYDGDLRAGYLGLEVSRRDWVAGLAVSRHGGGARYEASAGRGVLGANLTALYPYALWRSTRLPFEVWSIFGAGAGAALSDGAPRELNMRMGMLGLRARWAQLGGLRVRAVGHVGMLRLSSPAAASSSPYGMEADVRRVRMGIEGAYESLRLGVATLTPFTQAAARYDGGDGDTGRGLEVAGGLRLTAGRMGVEVRARALAAHTSSGYGERGLSLMAYVQPGADGSGLSASLAPRMGADTRDLDMTWREDPASSGAPGARPHPGALSARIGFGLPYPSGGLLLTPFTEMDLSADTRHRLRLGARVGSKAGALSLEVAGERRADQGRAPEHRVGLLGRMRF